MISLVKHMCLMLAQNVRVLLALGTVVMGIYLIVSVLC